MELFKVYFLRQNPLQNDELFVFHGKSSIDYNEVYTRDPYQNEILNIFTKQDIDVLIRDKIRVFFIDETINPDDTIIDLKIKIKHFILKNKLSTNEIYLFYKKKMKMSFEELFNPNIGYSYNDYQILLNNYNRKDIIESIRSSNENLDSNIIKELFINDFDDNDDLLHITQNVSMHTRFKDHKIMFPTNPFRCSKLSVNSNESD